MSLITNHYFISDLMSKKQQRIFNLCQNNNLFTTDVKEKPVWKHYLVALNSIYSLVYWMQDLFCLMKCRILIKN